NRHGNENREGNEGPEHLKAGVLMEIGGGGALTLAVMQDRPQHDAEYDDPDRHADPEDRHVETIDLPADLRYAWVHVDFPGGKSRRLEKQRQQRDQRPKTSSATHIM